MAEFIVQVRHVDAWRGTFLHKWVTDYPYVGTLGGISVPELTAFAELDASLCYNGTNGTGFIDSCALYDITSKGSPIEIASDLAMSYTGLSWAATAGARPQELQREVALLVEWPGGMSRTGKPVTFKKYIHAVPTTAAAGPGEPDVAGGDITDLTATAANIVNAMAVSGLAMGNARRFAGGAPTVRAYYTNHQMPRGRRRKS